MFRILTFPLVAVALMTAWTPSVARAETNFGQVAMHVAYMLGNHHYSRKEFDDEVSGELLESYLRLLDPRRIYFTQEDIDAFTTKYQTTLDDHVLMRNVEPAQELYDRYLERVKNRIEFVRTTLKDKDFTFESDATIELRRDEAEWPQDMKASDQLWLKLLEENVLSETLIAESRAKEEAEKAAEKAEAEKAEGSEKADVELKEQPTPEVAEKSADEEEELTPNERVLQDYERLLETLEENDSEDVVNFFLSSLASTFDPHTEYMSQSEIDNFNITMKHSLVGIGALLEAKDDVAEIKGIVVGGPADKQGGLQLGDQIIAVAQGELEFVDTKFMKLNKIVDMIRGEEGTVVRLKVSPASDRSSATVIEIVRGEVELKEKLANAELIQTPDALGTPMKVGRIMLPSFYADMEEGKVSMTGDVERLLGRLVEEGIDGLVLDLRGNGGGSLEEAIKLTGLFVPAGPVVQAKDWRGSITWRESENPDPVYEGPMIVLTDKSSASASEILAAALQDYGRAVVIGDSSTFGKGTVQTILPVERYMPFFSDKSRAGALKVTIQKFYRIAGGSTQLEGVVPDLQFPTVRDVLDIGEAAAENPLPYDTIPARPYDEVSQSPLPIEQLRARLTSRLEVNPEFQYVKKEADRLKERIDRNQVSLNIEKRRQEREETEARREAQEEDRKKRAAAVAEKLGDDGFKTYSLTLDNVDDEKLVLDKDVSDEQRSGMRVASEDSGEGGDISDFPYGIEPAMLETIHVMRDLIELGSAQLATANAESSKVQTPEEKAAN